MRAERAIHGVPIWLLQEYLQELGGEINEEKVHGQGWEARIEKMESHRIGSLSVGKVRLILEGEEAVVVPLLEQLAWKTLRGGG